MHGKFGMHCSIHFALYAVAFVAWGLQLEQNAHIVCTGVQQTEDTYSV